MKNHKNDLNNNIKINDSNNGKELFRLLGDLDEEMVEDAWAEHGEEVIIMEEKSPFRFVKIAAGIAAAVAIVGGGVYGFNRYRNGLGYSPAASYSDESREELSEPESSAAENSEPEVIDHDNVSTIFVGLDGIPIMTSEITRNDSLKNPEDITLDDEFATVVCDGFAYFREPTGTAFNSFINPEKFDDDGFIGDLPENTNEWKRVYVGEEIGGLKLVNASTQFKVEPGDYSLNGIYIGTDYSDFIEFEGTIEVQGFLSVAEGDDYTEAGKFSFIPTENWLPILGGTAKKESFFESTVKDVEMLKTVNEIPSVYITDAKVSYEDIDNLELGYTVLARVTLSNLRYSAPASVTAEIDEVLVLTEPFEQRDSSEPKYSETGARVPIGKFLK